MYKEIVKIPPVLPPTPYPPSRTLPQTPNPIYNLTLTPLQPNQRSKESQKTQLWHIYLTKSTWTTVWNPRFNFCFENRNRYAIPYIYWNHIP